MCMIKHDAAFLCATWLCSGNNISELYEQLELFVICVNGCTDLPDITKLTLKCYTVCTKKTRHYFHHNFGKSDYISGSEDLKGLPIETKTFGKVSYYKFCHQNTCAVTFKSVNHQI